MRATELPELKVVDEWAVKRLSTGQEPPWEWYELMKLRDAIRNLVHTDRHTLAFDGSDLDGNLAGPKANVVQFPEKPHA